MTARAAAPEQPAPIRVVIAATAVMTMAVLPVSLIGATAVQMRADLGFDERALGFLVGLFFAATSMTGIPGGRLAERIGPRRGLILGATVGAASLLGIAGLARSLPTLVLFTLIGGVATGISLPAASLALVRGATFRPALMFGLQQSAPPAASLLAGMAVPAISLTVGWRWSFVAAVVLGVVGLATMPGSQAFTQSAASTPDRGERAQIRRRFAAVSVAIGFASAVAIAMGAFVVSSSVASGIAPGTAGILLAVGSSAGVAARLVSGALADRHPGGHLQGVAAMVALGAVGLAVFAVGAPVWIATLGVVLAYGFGYGWSGLLFFTVARLNPTAPALSIGVVNTGAAAGAAIGPPLFGVLVAQTSFATAWLVAAGLSIVAAGLLVRSASRLEDGQGAGHEPVRGARP